MKALAALLLSCLSLVVHPQDTDPADIHLPLKDGRITYEEVVHEDSTTAQELYMRALRWFSATYGSAKDVIQVNSPENNEVSGKGFFTINGRSMSAESQLDIWQSISIQCKDGRYRYTITDVRVRYWLQNTYTDESIPEYLDRAFNGAKYRTKIEGQVLDRMTELLSDLRHSMSNRTNKDW